MIEPDTLGLLVGLCAEYKVTFTIEHHSYGTIKATWRSYAAKVVAENEGRRLTGYGNASGETDDVPRQALLEAFARVVKQVVALKELQ